LFSTENLDIFSAQESLERGSREAVRCQRTLIVRLRSDFAQSRLYCCQFPQIKLEQRAITQTETGALGLLQLAADQHFVRRNTEALESGLREGGCILYLGPNLISRETLAVANLLDTSLRRSLPASGSAALEWQLKGYPGA
jgi:hypothetical protein